MTDRTAKKPLNWERRIKQQEEQAKKPTKTRGMPVPPSRRHKDKRDDKRQQSKSELRKEYVGMDRELLAKVLLMAAKASLGEPGLREAGLSERALAALTTKIVKNADNIVAWMEGMGAAKSTIAFFGNWAADMARLYI